MRFLCVFLAIAVCQLSFAAELTEREKQMARAIQASVKQAGTSYAAGNYDDAGKAIRTAMKQLDLATKAGSADFYDALQPLMKRIETAHTMLEFEDVSLPPFSRPSRPTAGDKPDSSSEPKPPTRRPTRTRKTTKPEPPPKPEISFTNTVAPILNKRCGRCHVADSKGGFNMSSFAALMKGPPEGVVIFAGDTVGSRLIETIETGDMPRGRDEVTQQELQTLKAWIVAGAKFDGPDPSAPIAGGTPPPTGQTPAVALKLATGSETVSFAADVAPILVKQCTGCHIDAMRTQGGLRMDTFAQLLRGGDSGAIVVPGKSAESLLIQKLRGSASGQRMPAGGRPALSEDSIKLISTWIDEGATLDGASERQPLGVMSQLAWASSASADEMSARRRELAEANVKLVASGNANIETQETEHFLVIGTASSGTLQQVAEFAESQMKTVKSVVNGKASEEFFHGRATIFVFPKRYDYSEFAKMVETRSVPSDWTRHWAFDGIDAYVAMVATEREDEDQIEDRLVAPLVSLAMATRGAGVPRWLAEGVGVATANRKGNVRDRDARRKTEQQLSESMAAMKNAKEFLDGKLTPEQTDRIGGAIASSMLDRTQRRNFNALLRNLDEGRPFDVAFQQAFRGTVTQFVETWMTWARGG